MKVHLPARVRSADIWAGLCVLILGLAAMVASLDIFVPNGSGLTDYLGPRAFPLAVSVALMTLGAVLIGRSVLHPRRSTESLGAIPTLLVMLGAMAAYLALTPVLGFTLSTALLLAGLFLHLGERRVWLAVLVAAGMSGLLTLGFRDGLNVALPIGLFGF